MRRLLLSLLPEMLALSPRERLRASLGALIGVLVTGLVCRAAIGDVGVLPVLIAPMGASAVLLFAVPASPLAQPWSLLAGNLVAAAVGVTAASLVADPLVAAALAIGVAIVLMLTLRCLHPPSGAVALTAVLGGSAIRDLGYGFVLWPVAANSLLMLAVAVAFNNLSGRSYPNRRRDAPAGAAPAAPPLSARTGFTSADLDSVLKDYDRLFDVGRGDLEEILRRAELRSYRRRGGHTTCADIMTRNVVAVAPGAPLIEALGLLRENRVKALPVTDEEARVVGLVTQTDLLDKARWDAFGPRLGFGRRLGLSLRRGRAPSGTVEDIMTAPARTAGPDTPIAHVVVQMAENALHHVPVVGTDRKLVGIVSQSDLVVALLGEAAERAPA